MVRGLRGGAVCSSEASYREGSVAEEGGVKENEAVGKALDPARACVFVREEDGEGEGSLSG